MKVVASLLIAIFFAAAAHSASGITISPSSASLVPGATQSFSATVNGTTNTAVSWAIQEGPNGGIVTTTGLYTATNTPGTYHLIAISLADPNASASAPITVSVITSGNSFSAPMWQAIGPRAIPNARSCDSANESSLLGAGKIQAFAMNLAQPSTMFAAGGVGPGSLGPASDAGIYTTVDGGTYCRSVVIRIVPACKQECG
jgi:hypothetical protein